MIAASFGQLLTLLIVLAALTWTVTGPDRLRRASELYLWLAFIFSIYYLQLVAEAVACWTGVPTMDAFRVIAVLHLIVVAAAMWRLGRQIPADDRLAATLLIAGAVVFWVGARTFPGSSLQSIDGNLAGHLWTSVSFLIATIVTLGGLALFTLVLHSAGDRYLSVLGLLLFAFGAILWTLHLAFRLTVVVQAVESWRATASAPPWFEPWRAWAAVLFAIYSVLAYCGLAAYGAALLKTGGLPRWVGWVCIVAGLLAAPLGGLPLFIHVPLWIVGILMLTREPGIPSTEGSMDRTSRERVGAGHA